CASLRAVVLLSFSLSYQSLTTESFPLSLHDALPIFEGDGVGALRHHQDLGERQAAKQGGQGQGGHESSDRLQHAGSFSLDDGSRSEEHTSELQSRENLVCRLLLEKKKNEWRDMNLAV